VQWFHEDWLDDHAACSHHHPGTVGSVAIVRRTRLDPASNYVRNTGLADLFAEVRELSVRTMIFDVETAGRALERQSGVTRSGHSTHLGDIPTVPSIRAVVFPTNSAYRPPAVPACDGLQVRYLASAEKPLRTAPCQDFPRPGAVAGDQLSTDGILAYPLGFTGPGVDEQHGSARRIGGPPAIT
jgi:hypothetical protein